MTRKTLEEKFWSKVNKGDTNECWNWKGSTNGKGYGLIKNNNKSIKASRFSYELHNGAIPEGFMVCHKCDNRLCVNPAHLELGDALKNSSDACGRGRIKRGENAGNAKLTWDKVREIRASNLPRYELTGIYKVSIETINRIKTNQTWRE